MGTDLAHFSSGISISGRENISSLLLLVSGSEEAPSLLLCLFSKETQWIFVKCLCPSLKANGNPTQVIIDMLMKLFIFPGKI